MAENEKLDLILAEMQAMKADMRELKTDMQNVKADVQGLKEDVQELKADMQNVKVDVQGLKEGVQELKADVQELEEETQDMKSEVQTLGRKITIIQLLLENEIRVNIQRVAEGHLDLSRNLQEAMRPSNEVEMLSIKVRRLESDMQEVKMKVFN